MKQTTSNKYQRRTAPAGQPYRRRAQLTRRILEGLDDYLICRHLDCAFVCPSADWIREALPGSGRPLRMPHERVAALPLAQLGWAVVGKHGVPREGGPRFGPALQSAARSAKGGAADDRAASSGFVVKHTLGSNVCAGDDMVFPTVWAEMGAASAMIRGDSDPRLVVRCALRCSTVQGRDEGSLPRTPDGRTHASPGRAGLRMAVRAGARSDAFAPASGRRRPADVGSNSPGQKCWQAHANNLVGVYSGSSELI